MRTLFIDNRDEINQIITACKTCYLAMAVNNIPYVLPMSFALDGDCVVLHSAQSGRMWETLKTNPHVCITWSLGDELAWQDIRVGCSYRVQSKSVLVEGKVEFVNDFDEKNRLLKALMQRYSDREFKFSKPAVENVGVLKVKIEKISAKQFGVKTGIRLLG